MSTNYTCVLPWLTIGGAPCSDHGACVWSPTLGRGVCQCDPGWSGKSDFSMTTDETCAPAPSPAGGLTLGGMGVVAPSNCQILDSLITALWAILLVESIACWVVAFPKSRWLYRRHAMQAQKAKSHGKTYRLWHNSAYFPALVFQCAGFPVLWAMCLLKLSAPYLHVGVDWLPTVLWWIARFFVYFATFSVQPELLSSILKGQRNLDRVIAYNYTLSYTVFFMAVMAQFIIIWPLTTYVDPWSPTQGQAAIIFYGVAFGVAMIVGAVQAAFIEFKVRQALDQSIQLAGNERTKLVKEKLSSMQSTYLKTMLGQATIFIALAALPVLWMCHDYFLPISWMAIGPLLLKSFNSIKLDETSKAGGPKKSGGTADGVAADVGPPKGPRAPAVDPDKNSKVSSSDRNVSIMHVYGIEEAADALTELSPAEVKKSKLLGKSLARLSVGTSDETSDAVSNPLFAPSAKEEDVRVNVRVSPAVRLLRAVTPRSKTPGGGGAATPSKLKQQFFADDEDDGPKPPAL